MKVTVAFNNSQKDIKIPQEIKTLIRKSVKQTLISEQYGKSCTVGVTFVGEDEIRSLNRQFRNIDRVTDVLSFPDETVDPENGELYLGDVVICAKRAVEQAYDFRHSEEREFCFLAVHSVLHLLGYDHENGEPDETIMFDKQEKILKELGIER